MQLDDDRPERQQALAAAGLQLPLKDREALVTGAEAGIGASHPTGCTARVVVKSINQRSLLGRATTGTS